MTQSDRPRVVITGMGAITAAGTGVPALEAALRGTSHCFQDVTLFSTEGLRVHIAGEVAALPESDLATRNSRHRSSRSDKLALVATQEALEESDLPLANLPRERLGVAIGTSTGGLLETEEYFDSRLHERPAGSTRPRLLSSAVGAPTDLIASALGALGPRIGPSTACSSSAISLAMAHLWIRSGAADVVIAGGTDSLCRMTYTGFHALQALAPEPCRPFDQDRQGLTLGEGAAVLVLESQTHAERRGATVLGELAGAGLSCDAVHPTAPHADGRGAREALQAAIEDAGVAPTDIGYVNAHGTGTVQNDSCESRALQAVFEGHASQTPVSSTKGLLGHLLGAAGAVESIATLLAMRENFIPATVGLKVPDPECPFDLVRGAVREAHFDVAASNSYGFGGNNCSLIFKRA